ncbi:DUF397 domain-containing protein [Nonomuraea angiospora]
MGRAARASGDNGGDCVEVAPLSGGRVAMRDSKDKGEGPALVFTRSEWGGLQGRDEQGRVRLLAGSAKGTGHLSVDHVIDPRRAVT